MGKFDGYLMLSDIDGTLTDSHGRISEENAQAIKYFQSEGGLFTVASGRFPDFIDGFSSAVEPNTYIIGINGTVIYDQWNKKDLVTRTFDGAFMEMMRDAIDNNPEIHNVYVSHRHDNIYFPKDKFGEIEKTLASYDYEWYRVLFEQHSSLTDKVVAWLNEKYGDAYSINCSWSCGIEIHAKNSGKGCMLDELAKIVYPRGEKRKTIAVGDYGNDVTMLEAADYGYAVANAAENAKKAANRHTVSNNESPIARIIEELEAEL